MSSTVSVLIPAYNAADHLRRSIESALAQTRPPEEILVVDDGSSDDTAAMAEGYGSPVRVVRHPRNRGLSATRNTGIRSARSEWIALLDADDLWYPRKLERQMEAVSEADASIGVVFCLAWIVGMDGVRWIDSKDVPDPDSAPEAFTRALLTRNAVSGSGCSPLIRRDLLLRAGGYDETLRTCEDWDLWLRLARRTRFRRVDPVMCQGHARAEGLSLKLSWLLEDADAVLNRHLGYFVDDAVEADAIRREAMEIITDYVEALSRESGAELARTPTLSSAE